MSGPLFPRWTNTVSRLSAAALLAVPAIGIGGLMAYVRSPYVTNQQMPVEQPIEFDHRHHAGDEQIDCRYCHWTVEKAPSAGIPSTTVCMSCHAQVWNKSPYLTEVRKAFFSDQPIPWVRVHNLPDFVYFNHSIHVNKGVGCATCHGRIDQMGAVEQHAPLTMAWCLDCHRNPEPNLRPAEFITSMTWSPPADKAEAAALGKKLKEEYDVHSRTSCSTCHR
ncbi:cytochrome c3 family protein [Pyxidicoccus parkwayensis]|uniref:Cytochrome c3 family protein n=1 Tax=Pyxidicoccus parkwayensis TaxID=2813578 RepID=A0ABX7NYA7_9BACT|nr:cytochrome c3 family protein [Pyxidicoccus parkwaysis]QSQ23421.1 cytochrome c3 family protein [Pyxidicoccus parkwaysis]